MAAPASKLKAVLGPTNTGKTHLAVERLLAHGTGMIGLPLRLLAREIYDRMARLKGPKACALITGEERIWPETARYFACTVEAMPLSHEVDFLAVDEVQLAQDPDRGHVFTDRILHARGRHETMLLGADTMRQALRALDLDVDAERRERFSQLSYAGPIKITKLPKRSAVVAFSAEEVYAIAELLKRQRGGCAVVMGALSPRTRNAQVDLYQSGEVDYIVATDAIGMGLNLDVGHIAFASIRKFDGRHRRPLRPDELAQIAGRAGRFRDDGSFGETGDCEPIDEETVARIVEHHFDPIETLNWRNSALDFASSDALLDSLRRPTRNPSLRRAPEAIDETTLAALVNDPDVASAARTPAHVRRLWDLCTLPDFRKSGEDAHIRLVGGLVEKLIEPAARIKDEWMYKQVEPLDRTEGDIDVLQQRLANIRTWTYAANRSDWLENAATWQGRTREIEDKLSDALHERLMQRFVDRRTSALLKALNSEDDTPAELGEGNVVLIGGHKVGRLDGLKFIPDTAGQTLEGRALRNAALKALRPVIERRLMDLADATDADFSLRAGSLSSPAAPSPLIPTKVGIQGESSVERGIEAPSPNPEQASPTALDAAASIAEAIDATQRSGSQATRSRRHERGWAGASTETTELDAKQIEIHFRGAPVARLKPSADWLKPRIDLLGALDAHSALRTQAEARLAVWLEDHARKVLLPIFNLRDALNDNRLKGLARGVAFQLAESGAALDLRGDRADQPQAQLGPEDRRALKEAGVRAGRLAAFLSGLLKPAAGQLAILLRSLNASLAPVRAPTASSFPAEGWPRALLEAAGYIRLGPRGVRADMADRLFMALSETRRASETSTFVVAPDLAALIGCPLTEFEQVLRGMGLKPAERDDATKAVTRWRFAARRKPEAPKPNAPPPPPPTGPFAALAQLRLAQPEPAARQRRRRKRRPPTPPAPKTAAE